VIDHTRQGAIPLPCGTVGRHRHQHGALDAGGTRRAADVERDLIRTRTAEGRSRATAQGKHMGRPPSVTPAQIKEATRRRAQGATLQELADSYDRSMGTMRRATRAA